MRIKKARRYKVETTTLDPKFALKTYTKGFECVSLRMARALVKEDIFRTLDRFHDVNLTVNYGMKESVISCNGKEVLKFHITYVGDDGYQIIYD